MYVRERLDLTHVSGGTQRSYGEAVEGCYKLAEDDVHEWKSGAGRNGSDERDSV